MPAFDQATLRAAVMQKLMEAQDPPGQKGEAESAQDLAKEHNKIGVGPYAALFGGEAADIGTTLHAQSQGAQEGNPLLGNFGKGAIAGKLGGALLTAILIKKLAEAGHPGIAKALGYGSGIGLGAVAAHNATVGK